MDHFEMVEKLRAKANVSYEEAKAALEACNWDLLDALVFLEGEGKLNKNGAAYTTKEPERDNQSHEKRSEQFTSVLQRIGQAISRLIKKGNSNSFVVMKNAKEVLSLPLTALFLLFFIVAWWILVPLLVLGLFCGFRYTFKGPQMDNNQTVKNVMNKVADTVDNIKNTKADNDNGPIDGQGGVQ